MTLTGSNFANVTGVSVGGNPLGDVLTLSVTQLRGVTPPALVPGAKDVMVSTASGTAACRGCFTYMSEVLRVDFDSDVFAGSWKRTHSSVAVDLASSVLRIGANGLFDDRAEVPVSAPFPLTIEVRMRLMSGGQNYRLPYVGIGYGNTLQEALLVTYLPGVSFGWAFGSSSDLWTRRHEEAPRSENVWITVSAEVRSDGGRLLVRADGQGASTVVTSRNWSIPSRMTTLFLVQPWDAVCEFDYVRIISGPH